MKGGSRGRLFFLHVIELARKGRGGGRGYSDRAKSAAHEFLFSG